MKSNSPTLSFYYLLVLLDKLELKSADKWRRTRNVREAWEHLIRQRI